MRQIVRLAIRDDLRVDHVLNVRRQPSDFVCYEPALEAFHEKCFNLNKVGLRITIVALHDPLLQSYYFSRMFKISN